MVEDTTKENIIFFDGVCGLCNGFVIFILQCDRKKHFRYSPLQGETAKKYLPAQAIESLDSIIYLTRAGEILSASDAVIAILTALGGGWKLMSLFKVIPRPIRDFVYGLVAKYRYRIFGKRDQCFVPLGEERLLFLE